MNGPPVQIIRWIRARSAAAYAGLRGHAEGLSPIQIEALQRFARDQVLREGASGARAAANTRRMAARMRTGGAA